MSSVIAKTREVTKILADLDLFFTFSKASSGSFVWQLVPFQVPDRNPVPVTLLLTDLWLYVHNVRQLNQVPEAQALLKLLNLNMTTSGAKIGWLLPTVSGLEDLAPDTSEGGGISIAAEIWTEHLSAESLQQAIGAVVYVSGEVRKIIPE